ncbi:lytic transglycosylase, partial [Cellulomonas septica]
LAVTATGTAAHADEQVTVRSGDTVSHIAARHGSTVTAVRQANGLDARAFIRVGQVLTIPTGSSGVRVAPVATTAPAPAAATYTVRNGDTVSHIASRHGTTVAAIVSANGLDARAFIRVGQTLTIPGVAPAAATSVGSTFAGRSYPAATVSAANANLAALRASAVPSKADMRAKITATARAYGVDPALALAVAFQESGFNHAVVSPANAIGTMQVIPSSGKWASDLVGRPLDLLNPDDNVVAGVAILRSLVRNAPDLPTAIAGYYQGASSVKRNGMFTDTKQYVANVQSHMTRFA